MRIKVFLRCCARGGGRVNHAQPTAFLDPASEVLIAAGTYIFSHDICIYSHILT